MRYDQIIPIVRELQPKVVMEIGTWNGARAIEMMKQTNGVYYGFDLFEEANEQTDFEESNVKPHHSINRVAYRLDGAKLQFCLVKGNTRKTLPMFRKDNPDVRVDFAYIDGGHSVETIRSDWEHVRAMMNPGGVVVFDDYYIPASPRWGCNAVLEGEEYEILPLEDKVFGSELDGYGIRLVRVNV